MKQPEVRLAGWKLSRDIQWPENHPLSTWGNWPLCPTHARMAEEGILESNNVQWVCYSMNIAKGHWENNEFLAFLKELRNP